jgi:hypothetical protein
MARRVIKKLMPDHDKIKQTRLIRLFGSLLHDANLWHLNRRSASGAFAVGLFTAFIPVPFQMALAAAAAIPFRVNLPLSVGLVWVSNPITMPPMFYLCYRVGNWLLSAPPQPFSFELSWDWLFSSISTIGPSLITGCLVLGTVASIIGYLGIRFLWRRSVVKAWRRRPGSRHLNK